MSARTSANLVSSGVRSPDCFGGAETIRGLAARRDPATTAFVSAFLAGSLARFFTGPA
jgi:hypothetical protein